MVGKPVTFGEETWQAIDAAMLRPFSLESLKLDYGAKIEPSSPLMGGSLRSRPSCNAASAEPFAPWAIPS